MRTTLTIDDDVAVQLKQLRQTRNASLKQTVNETLRLGLRRDRVPRPPEKRSSTKAVSLGRCLVGSIDDVAEALAVAEGEGFR
jgi:hypothetical protein